MYKNRSNKMKPGKIVGKIEHFCGRQTCDLSSIMEEVLKG
jgi:hypothetical protein